MGAVSGRLIPNTNITDNLNARRIGGHHNHTGPAMGGRFRIGDHHHNQKARKPRIRRKPLLAIDDKIITILNRHTSELGWVGPALGLAHRIARRQLAVQQGLQILCFDLIAAIVGEDFSVAGIRRLATEDDRGKPRLT